MSTALYVKGEEEGGRGVGEKRGRMREGGGTKGRAEDGEGEGWKGKEEGKDGEGGDEEKGRRG